MPTFEGIYENGVVHFSSPIALPEHTKVTVVPVAQSSPPVGSNADELYKLLEARFESGVTDAAARVDELDP